MIAAKNASLKSFLKKPPFFFSGHFGVVCHGVPSFREWAWMDSNHW